MTGRMLEQGTNLAARIASGLAQVGPRFDVLPEITELDDDTISYEIGETTEGTPIAVMYRNDVAILEGLEGDGSIDLTPADAGSQYYIETTAINSSGNPMVVRSDVYIVTILPHVPTPVIEILEETTSTITFLVTLGAIEGLYLSEEVVISDELEVFENNPDGILVTRSEFPRQFTVSRTVIALDGTPTFKFAEEDILSPVQIVVFETGVFETGVFY